MKIQYASDLHLEYEKNSAYLRHHPLQKTGDVLLLAGDIGYIGDYSYTDHPFWDWAAANYEQVIVVPGNHELYKRFDIEELEEGWSLEIRPNVHCYYNRIVSLREDIDLIVSTLWSHIRPENGNYTEYSVTDFHRIRSGEDALTWMRFNEEHDQCRDFIRRALMRSRAHYKIVLSHHVPSMSLLYHKFAAKAYSGAFAAELEQFIAQNRIDYWIFGHSHFNNDGLIGRTHCLCNQLGYIAKEENWRFDPEKHIVIP